MGQPHAWLDWRHLRCFALCLRHRCFVSSTDVCPLCSSGGGWNWGRGGRSACRKPPPPVSLSATSAERARVCFPPPPPLAPHECFSGGIFRDGVLCKWHLSCDLPREREGGREGSGGKGAEGKRRRGKMEAEEGRTDGFPRPLCSVTPSALPSVPLPHFSF